MSGETKNNEKDINSAQDQQHAQKNATYCEKYTYLIPAWFQYRPWFSIRGRVAQGS